jgi:hypothetical protein
MAVGSGELTDMVTNGAESGLKVFADNSAGR